MFPNFMSAGDEGIRRGSKGKSEKAFAKINWLFELSRIDIILFIQVIFPLAVNIIRVLYVTHL